MLSETLVIVCSGCMNGLDKVKDRIVEHLAVQQWANKLDQQFFGEKDACAAKARGDGKFETYAGLVASSHGRTFEHREMTAA